MLFRSVTSTPICAFRALLGSKKNLVLGIGIVLASMAGVATPVFSQTLTNLTISPGTIYAPNTATGTVTLSSPAPTGGASVCLTSNNTNAATVPTSMTVNAGSTTGTFTVQGVGNGTANIVATYGASKTATITVFPQMGGGGGGGSTYLYEVHDVANPSAVVTTVSLLDIYMPKTMKITWTSAWTSANYEVRRDTTTLGQTTTNVWPDAFNFVSGQLYQYSVRVLSGYQTMGLPAPPQGADPTKIAHLQYVTGGPWTTINVTPNENIVQDNQTVDSRYDLRYSTYVYKDFKFGSFVYRGGLFAGYGNDPARVGRSFLKFNLPAWPTGQDLWLCGTLNLYYTRMYKTGSTTVGLTSVANTWDPTTLVWSNAPTFDPTTSTKTFTVNDDSNHNSAAWYHCDYLTDITAKLAGDRLLAVGVASTNEASANWAYFAKKEYIPPQSGGGWGPRVLYAWGNTLQLEGVTVSPTSVHGGNTATGTVLLNGPAGPGGVSVTVTSSNPSKAMVSACVVTIPEGSISANFTITTSTVTSNTAVTISAAATIGGIPKTVTCILTVTP